MKDFRTPSAAILESRQLRVMPSKPGGTSRGKSLSFRVVLPRPWLAAMGVDQDVRDVIVSFDGTRIIIEAPAAPTEAPKKIKMVNLTYKNLQFAHSASNNNANFSDLEFEADGVKYLIRNVPAPEGWDGESDWSDDDDYIDHIVRTRLEEDDVEVL